MARRRQEAELRVGVRLEQHHFSASERFNGTGPRSAKTRLASFAQFVRMMLFESDPDARRQQGYGRLAEICAVSRTGRPSARTAGRNLISASISRIRRL